MSDDSPWPFTLTGIEDPRRGFDALRAEAPLQFLAGYGLWVATGHRPVTALLRDDRCVTAPVPPAEVLGGGDAAVAEPVRRTLERMAVLSNAPEHRDRRLPLQRAFAPEVVEPARARVRAHARDLLAGASPPVDAVKDLAVPLFDRALDEALRLPAGAGRNLRRAWKKVSAAIDRPDQVVTAETAGLVLAVHESLAAHLAGLREQPAEPPDTAPIDVLLRVAGDTGLTDAEIIANLILALTSGHRSAAQALALAIHTLATHPGEYARLRADPSLVPRAVEELLRFDGSVHFTNRLVTEDVEVDGCPVGAGSIVMLVLGGANHDPEMFPDRELDVGATRRPHLSFGRGAHYCPGAPLARLAMVELLGELVARVEQPALAAPPTFTAARRGLDSLLVTW